MAKRILIVAALADSLLNFRGPLIADLIAAGCEVATAAAAEDAIGGIVENVPEKIRELGATFHPIPLARASISPRRDLETIRAIRQLCVELRPDLVLLYTVKPTIYGSIAARRAKVPQIVSMITGLAAGMRTESDRRSRRGKAMAAFYKFALARNTGVIFQNPDDEALFRELGIIRPSQPTFQVCGSGVDLHHFSPQALPAGPPVFLMIARLLADKGVREYAAAAELVRKQVPDARVILAGPFDEHPLAIKAEEVEAWQKTGAIEYVGSLTDVRPVLAQCSVYVLPSYREGTPRTVLEAMAMGRAIITTDAPGCRQTVEPEVNGVLVPVASASALAAAMLRLAAQPELISRMGQESLRVVQKFDVHSVNRQVLSALGIELPTAAMAGVR